jgi:hypothetical protein
MQQQARGGFYTVFQRGQRYLPRMQQRVGGSFYMAFRRCSRHHGCRIARPILTSQYCMAVSIDTCFAIARFFGWFWRVNSQWVTPHFPKTWNTPGLSVRCITYLCALYTVSRQHWANAVPLNDGDILGPCSTTTHHSPMMRPSHGSSAAAFCDEVMCHVIVSASLHRVNASSWTRPGPLCLNPTFLALATYGNNERKQQTDQCRH